MTLAALASTCATPRPSGEDPVAHAVRVLAGIRNQLSDPGLATGGTWEPVWLAMSPGNTNLCYIARNLTAGTNEYAVAIRGTAGSATDILEDIDVGTVVSFDAGGSPSTILVSKGAMDAFTQTVNARSPLLPIGGVDFPGTTLSQALAGVLDSAPSAPPPTVYVTGHSLGGCLASMVALYLQAQKWANPPGFAVYTIAAPTAGLDCFATYFRSVDWTAYQRTINAYDVVPQAWVDGDLKDVLKWYPPPGPNATVKVQGIIDVFRSMPNGNVYCQPGDPVTLNNDPGNVYGCHDPDLVNDTFEDFMGQAAFQHGNNTYLTLLGAPTIPAGPVVTGLSPAHGQPGTQVKIVGSGFTSDSVVDFGPIRCEGISVGSDTEITLAAPDGAGLVEVTVTTVAGTSPAAQSARFAYGAQDPLLVMSIDPRHGDRKSSVTINGSGFVAGCKVFFGSDQSDSVSVASSSLITAYPPVHLAGTVDITVQVGFATSPTSPADEFTYDGLLGANA